MRGSMAGDGESRQLEQEPFVKGQRIDRYEIAEHVGEGGMGAVYRAVDTRLGRTVALKTVAAHQRGDKLTQEIRERFMREALAASRVDHRNVVQVLDFGFCDDGTPYMVMEFLRGRSLRDLLKGAREPMASDSVADIMLSVCAALRACHHAGVIHRDLKPANIFLCDTDTGWEVKVLDFGISKAPAADALTRDGQIIGTPQYLSPEQIEGNVGPEADQYAVGVVLYACLTRRLPYASYRGTPLLRAISAGKFDPPRALRPDLPEGLEAIVLRAMHVSPAQRFESIHALGQRLWEFASPRGQTEWKTFYFQGPAPAEPATLTTSTNDVAPRVASAARPAPGTTAPGEGHRRGDATASLQAVSPVVATAPPSQATIGPAAYDVTRTAAAAGGGDATTSQSDVADVADVADIAGESAVGEARARSGAIRSGPAARWRIAVAVVALTAAGAVGVRRTARSNAPGTPAPQGAIARPTAPTVPSPSAPPTPSLVPAAAPSPTAIPAAPPHESTPARKKQATHRHPAPKIDQHGIGIPTE
jgi:serine/threonine protein kinase